LELRNHRLRVLRLRWTERLAPETLLGDQLVLEPVADYPLVGLGPGDDVRHRVTEVELQRLVDVGVLVDIRDLYRGEVIAAALRNAFPQLPAHDLQLEGLDVRGAYRLRLLAGSLYRGLRESAGELFRRFLLEVHALTLRRFPYGKYGVGAGEEIKAVARAQVARKESQIPVQAAHVILT